MDTEERKINELITKGNLLWDSEYHKRTHISKERHKDVERVYRDAVRINPDCGSPHNALGVLFYYQRRFDEAEEEFRKAIIDQSEIKARNNLGLMLYDLGRHEEAKAIQRTIRPLLKKKIEKERKALAPLEKGSKGTGGL